MVGGPPLTDSGRYVDLIDSLLGPDDDPKSAFRDLKKIEGLHFDGSKCATCPSNCCVVHDPDEQYIAIREDELDAIYAAYPDAARVRASRKGRDGRRYYTVTRKGARCAFLGDDMRCAVYSARPRYCRENPGNSYQLHGWDGVKYDLKRCPGTTYDNPVLCLNSGGVGSLVLQAHLKTKGFTPYSLFVDHGQEMRERERESAEKIAAFYGGKFYSESVNLELTSEDAREALFFAMAAAYCDALTIPRMGLMWEKRRKGLKIMSPFAGKTKPSIRRIGEKYGVPFELAFSRSESSVSTGSDSISYS